VAISLSDPNAVIFAGQPAGQERLKIGNFRQSTRRSPAGLTDSLLVGSGRVGSRKSRPVSSLLIFTLACNEVDLRDGHGSTNFSRPNPTRPDVPDAGHKPTHGRSIHIHNARTDMIWLIWHTLPKRSRVHNRTLVFSRGCFLPRVRRTDVQRS